MRTDNKKKRERERTEAVEKDSNQGHLDNRKGSRPRATAGTVWLATATMMGDWFPTVPSLL